MTEEKKAAVAFRVGLAFAGALAVLLVEEFPELGQRLCAVAVNGGP